MSEDHNLNDLDARISTRGYFERIIKEQQEALKVAEVEREKAAANVRRALENTMKAGDDRLQDHITHQIESVKQALAGMTLLLSEKEGRLDDRFKAQDKASSLALFNSNEAIKVARTEAKERLDSHNNLIEKMDRLVASFPSRNELSAATEKIMVEVDRLKEDTARIVGREVFDQSQAEHHKWQIAVEKRLDSGAGKEEGSKATKESLRSNTNIIIGVIATIVVLVNFYFSQHQAAPKIIVQTPTTQTTP